MSMKDNLFIKSANKESQDAAKFAAPATLFWRQVLNFLQNEESNLEHYFVREQDFEEESIIDTIQSNADLNENAWSAIYENEGFWNESINDAIDFLKDLKKIKEGQLYPLYWAWEDIIYANAAWDFDDPYVRPNYNIDGDYYTLVREDDAFNYALTNSANLQFTHTNPQPQTSETTSFAKWLRLIMPKNTRRVEIEDLDRNFWVIGQSLSIISKYLFDDGAPLAKILGDLLREITEQWENMLYLWADYTTMTGRSQSINLILDLPNDPLHPYRKFDGFDSTPALRYNDQQGWQERNKAILDNYFAYLPKKYPKSKISLWVRQRHNNYYNNYFHTDIYPYYGYYDGSEWKWFLVLHTIDDEADVIKTTAISEGLKDEVYGFNKNGQYGIYHENETTYPITALRVKVKIEKGGLKPTLKYEVYDAVEQMIEEYVEPLRKYESRMENGVIYMDNKPTGHQAPSTSGPITNIILPIYPGEIPTNNYEEWM